MAMRKIIFIFSVILFFGVSLASLYAQEKKTHSSDALLKEALYKEHKAKVLNYSLKEFDTLFFEFFDKKADPNLLLTKQEFYTYTIKIAIFSDRLAALYPDQKEIASANKKEWFAKTYEDYLLFKATQKK